MKKEYNIKHYDSKNGRNDCYVQQFDSMHEFKQFIKEEEFNNTFKHSMHSSEDKDCYDGGWHGTKTLEEAYEMLENGWSVKAEKLKQQLSAYNKSTSMVKQQKSFNSVAGYQALVPAYLSNDPMSMVSKKMVSKKQKVVTIVRQGNFLSDVSSSRIEEEALKALKVITKIEASGYRVNLYSAFISSDEADAGTGKSRTATCCIVKLKGANERMNVSKLAFPLVNAAFFRRMVFRWREKFEHTPRSFNCGYGSTMQLSDFISQYGFQGVFKNGAYGIDNFVNFNVDDVHDLSCLTKLG